MQLVKQKRTKWVEASPTTSVEEYRMSDPTISGATAIVSGRYPEKGYVANVSSHELVLVLSGNGLIGTKRKRTPIELGDCILLRPKEKYYWDGHMAIFIATTPKWKSKQHKMFAR